ncbi:MAG: hypothetical protein K0M70_10340 [Arenimonas sp.]|uniref:hypothetical protein n=1 Tax=Arenimonas sp. TaxID=1872635 RepID=UPI0025BA2CAC|nr:hypothetical protein [Arenimonas sp.]MBW8368244.1 hypothetical protein [Arenimonas sp.]
MRFRFFACLLMLCGLAAADPALAFGRCTDPGYLAGFAESLTPRRCRTIHTTHVRWRGGVAEVRVIVDYTPTPALDAGHDEFIRRVDELATRLGRAMDAMGGLTLPPTTVFLSNIDYGGFHAGTFGAADECKVIYFKTAREITLDAFLFTYAHELFHCMQAVSFPGTWQPDAEQRRAGALEVDWWMEGSAEYFAHLANPGSSEGQRFIGQFDRGSPDDSLLDMNYPAVVFFLGLGHRRGPEGVRSFLRRMAPSPGRDAQLAALQAALPMPDWIGFGEDYLDGRIRFPDGRDLESVVNNGATVVFAGEQRHESSTDPYVLARETFKFNRGRRYNLAIEGATGELRSRFGEDGRWTDPPSRVLACNEDKFYTVLTVAVEGDVPRHTFVSSEPERVDERACCLIGDWAPTPAAVAAQAAQVSQIGGVSLAAHGASMSCSAVGEPWVLSFEPGARGEVRWSGFGHRCSAGDSTGQMVQTATRRGSTSFTWDIRSPEAGIAHYTGQDVVWTYDMQMGPLSLPSRSMRDSGPSTGSNGFAYTCSRDTLTIQGIYGLSADQSTYTRIGGAPIEP